MKDALEIFKHDELVAEPGSKFQYTTHGFTLLSAALEKAANESYVDQITNLFRELGMNHSYLDLNFPLITNRARYFMYLIKFFCLSSRITLVLTH